MADFSKQYCDIWDQGFPYDFDIEEIASSLDKDHYYPIICEGFGFIAIGKDESGKITLAFGDENDTDGVKWQEYDTFIASQYKLSEEITINGNKIF